MKLLERGRFVPDIWAFPGPDDPVPEHGAVALPLARFNALRETLLASSRPLGLVVGPAEKVRGLNGDLARLSLIALVFPKLADGRAFTQARILREHMGYRGTLRATGAVLRDQLFYMARCGFDAFELPDGEDEAGAVAALSRFTAAYQPAADNLRPAFRVRSGS
jgi:uncharacterized protein (DUF934 family)